MTTKLTVNRYRTRRLDITPLPSSERTRKRPIAPEADQQQNLPPQAKGAASAQAANAAGAKPAQFSDEAFFPSDDSDGFGDEPFATARGPALKPSDKPAPAYQDDRSEMAPHDIDAIRKEGLTGRQLRMARRLAQKHGLSATSDFDAVRLLRQNGIDPFQANSILELVSGDGASDSTIGSRALTVSESPKLPQTLPPETLPSPDQRAEQAHIAEVSRIQRDIAKRRRRRSILLGVRLFIFVGLPTLIAAIYYYTIATPLYSSQSQFVIQQAEPAAAAGMASLLKGTAMASSQDSIAVQGYLQSPDAMERLNSDQGFRAHFADPKIDPIQRLAANASDSAAYKLYQRNVKISYDPTEGIIKMEVIAADPQKAVDFSKALISYAEDQVDNMSQRLREDQMQGAREAYADAEKKLTDANTRVLDLQEKYKVLSSEVEVSLVTGQITQLDTMLTQDKLSLAQMESNANPNQARMDPVKRRIATLESQIADLRSRLTEDSSSGLSLARVQSELLVAQADAQTRQLMLAQSLQAMETSRVEASRQTRFLSMAVNPVVADEATYPRAFENTLVVLLIFAGIYLMISMTIAILREQITA